MRRPRAPTFLFLLLALLGTFVVYPLAVESATGALMADLVAMLIATAALVALRAHKHELAIGLSLAIPSIVMDWLCDFVFKDSTAAAVTTSALYAAFHAYVTILIMRYIVAARRVTANEVWASACVYLMLAIVWADVMHLTAVLRPTAFRALDATLHIGGSGSAYQSDLLYYSLTTLTTLGMGDIVPGDRVGRTLTALEAVVGQLCIGILIARLVGLHIAAAALSGDRERSE
ncbi:MAG: potassium channel family protein [Phycisphaerales bacterium]